MPMTFYENVKGFFAGNLEQIYAVVGLEDPTFDKNNPECREKVFHRVVLNETIGAIQIMAHLDVLNDPRNDQCQTAARQLAILLCQRLDVDPKERYGIDLDV